MMSNIIPFHKFEPFFLLLIIHRLPHFQKILDKPAHNVHFEAKQKLFIPALLAHKLTA